MVSKRPASQNTKPTIWLAIALAFSLFTMITSETSVATTHTVIISDFAFNPHALTIKPGDTVTWNNTDQVIYTLWFVRIDQGTTYLLSDPIPPENVWSYTFNEAVNLQYYDFNRLWINGSLTVTTTIHDIAITYVKPWKTVVGKGYATRIDVNLQNQGDSTENLDVKVYADLTNPLGDEITVETQTITGLFIGETRPLVFTWTTASNITKGNYTLSAVASTVPGETDTVDNAVICATTVKIVIVGDMDANGKVEIKDFALMAKSYGANYPDPRYNANYDIDSNGRIEIKDFSIAAKNYGKIDP